MKKNSIYVALLAAVLLTSCGGSSDSSQSNSTATEQAASSAITLESLVDTDLNSQGFPVIIKAPKDAKLTKNAEGTEILVDAGDGFKLEIRNSKTTDFAESVSTQKDMVSDTSLYPNFDKFEINEPQGYVKKSKSGEKSFFYAVPLNQGGGYISIKPEMMSTFSPETIDVMYQAAKLAKVTDAK